MVLVYLLGLLLKFKSLKMFISYPSLKKSPFQQTGPRANLDITDNRKKLLPLLGFKPRSIQPVT